MDVKESERVVVAKPVPSRPTCPPFRSFSELLAGAINASPSIESSQATVSAIRPKTVRFKPSMNRPPPAGFISSEVNFHFHQPETQTLLISGLPESWFPICGVFDIFRLTHLTKVLHQTLIKQLFTSLRLSLSPRPLFLFWQIWSVLYAFLNKTMLLMWDWVWVFLSFTEGKL